jgi:endonuclease III
MLACEKPRRRALASPRVPRPRSRLQRLLALLAPTARAAETALPPRDPWHAILWENVAYLCTDVQRAQAFAALDAATGLDARVIARVPDEVLLAATSHGKMAAQRVAKLRECAQLFADVGDPRALVQLPLPKALTALARFPGIGRPGAERLLLFAGAAPLLALESNGLRALLRLGYGTEAKSYAASYRSAQQAAAAELPETTDARAGLYATMRAHGRATCRATPLCAQCAVAGDCPSARTR